MLLLPPRSRLAASVLLAAALLLVVPARAVAQDGGPPPSDFAALEAAGVRIGAIRVRTEDVFDLSDERENRALYRLANTLHRRTRAEVIERALLFKTGDRVDARVIEETERLLRARRYLYDVRIRALEPSDGVVDIEVTTRDTWTLEVGTSVSRAGGANATGISIADYNLFGTGATLALGRSNNVDRSSTAITYFDERAFGTWLRLGVSHASNSDGHRNSVTVLRPFYALDARWAGGVSGVKDNRIDSVYTGGTLTSQYRVRQASAEAFVGWSPGLRNGWVQRYSAGLQLLDDAFSPEPGLAAPPELPPDRRLRAPFVRWELIEDRVERERNHNLIGRPEFFPLGWASSVQAGYTLRALGSTQDARIYAVSAARGFEPVEDHKLLAGAALSGQYFDGEERRQRAALEARWYVPHGPHRLFYAAGSMQWLNRPDPAVALRLGGEEGLRGYPLRYQNGTRRALFTVEERFYTELYPWRLFRIGGAVFFDVGRAWGGNSAPAANTGWLSDVGAGLRITNARSAFGNVLHIDVAVPLETAPDVKRVQLLVKTKASF
jgi:hypothetical protein